MRTVAQEVPLSRDTSIFTVLLGVRLTDDQVIVCVEPTSQVSVPSGAVTVIAGGGGPMMVKLASLVSETVGVVTLVTLILAVSEAIPVNVQG